MIWGADVRLEPERPRLGDGQSLRDTAVYMRAGGYYGDEALTNPYQRLRRHAARCLRNPNSSSVRHDSGLNLMKLVVYVRTGVRCFPFASMFIRVKVEQLILGIKIRRRESGLHFKDAK